MSDFQSADTPENLNTEANLETFLNANYGVIGRTASTRFEPNTSSEFQFWLSKIVRPNNEAPNSSNPEIAPIEIGNIVAAYSDQRDDITFGIVTEMRSYSDVESFIADYLSHDFGDATIEVPTDISEVTVVTCAVMRNLSLKTKPVGRSRVYFPSDLGIQFAYGIVDENRNIVFSGAPIPVGVFENGDNTVAPISVDEDFLLGPEGAHLNVSGISGLASKTSAIQFVLKSVLTHSRKRIAVVMFNVKSKDLLYIDQLNTRLETEEWSRQAYETLLIPAEPFINARFFAPADPTRRPDGTQSLRELPITSFEWDLQMIYHQIPSLFDSMDWDDRMEGVWFAIQDEIERGELLTYAQMLNWVEREITRANNSQQQWIRGNHIATWNKMRSHLRRFPRSYQGLISTAGQGRDIPWSELSSGAVYVIDIQMLNDRGQRLVFGRAVSTLSRMLENDELGLDAAIVFVDELNKFAPSGSARSPLKTRLIDITARGRSLGLILFGAEQFASSVDKEIVENSSTYLFGRTETNELRTPNFSAFSDEVKTKLTMLPQGQLLIKFAKFPQPIFLRFPYPPCLPGDRYQNEQ
jgi:hypothetical protein